MFHNIMRYIIVIVAMCIGFGIDKLTNGTQQRAQKHI